MSAERHVAFESIARWDGETYKTDPVTGRQVPDETAVIIDKTYEGVTAAEWPEADFIVGNPPFIGGKDKWQTLGHGYFDALIKTYKDPVYCSIPLFVQR